MKILLLLSVVTFFIGCAGIPFEPIELMPIEITPQQIVAKNMLVCPGSYTSSSAFTFRKFTSEVFVVGYTEIDESDRAFRVALMNPMGVKVLEISGTNGVFTNHFMVEQLADIPDLLGIFGTDIERLYFDCVPSKDAEVIIGEKQVEFIDKASGGEVHYLFGGCDYILLKKIFYEGNKKVCSVNYFDYQIYNGKQYPHGMTLNNHKDKYRLVIKLKNIVGD